MRLFIESTSIDMWEIIENGDYVPTIEQPVPHVVADLDQAPPVTYSLKRANLEPYASLIHWFRTRKREFSFLLQQVEMT